MRCATMPWAAKNAAARVQKAAAVGPRSSVGQTDKCPVVRAAPQMNHHLREGVTEGVFGGGGDALAASLQLTRTLAPAMSTRFGGPALPRRRRRWSPRGGAMSRWIPTCYDCLRFFLHSACAQRASTSALTISLASAESTRMLMRLPQGAQG